MKKSPIHIIYLICFLIPLCSCTISSSGSSIYGFTKRINKLDKSYCLSADGYIIDQENKTFTKYFTINEKNLMQKFTYNQKNELDSMSIVFDNLTADDTAQLKFIKDSIFSFVCNDAQVNKLFDEVDFENALFLKDINTKKAKNCNTEILIDVTEIGTVITVLQNTP
jgi:hypothetical protein